MAIIPELEQFCGKQILDIKAYGTDEYDFSPNLLDADFSVGQFGYVAFIFDGCTLYASTDGLSATTPVRENVSELKVRDITLDEFVGRYVFSITAEDSTYIIELEQLGELHCTYHPKGALCDRDYFDMYLLHDEEEDEDSTMCEPE